MQQYKILVVDDDPVSRMLLAKILDHHLYTFSIAGNAEEAFEILSDRSFSLILMDIEMPDTDGLEAIQFIRGLSADYFKRIPVIALTAHRREDILQKASLAGMNEVLSKPIDINNLLSAINRFAKNTVN